MTSSDVGGLGPFLLLCKSAMYACAKFISACVVRKVHQSLFDLSRVIVMLFGHLITAKFLPTTMFLLPIASRYW
ncbi:MAG: hypothetical protein R3C99_24045 [Pirellulaceae bacterium]